MATVPSLVPKVAAFLVTIAGRRRRTTYGEVARAVGTGARVVPKTLEVIRAICLERGWPALTAIVVNVATGKPGDAFLDPWLPRDADASTRDAMTKAKQAEVYAFDWSPLLAYFGEKATACAQQLPVDVTFQAEQQDGTVRLTFPDGFQTTLSEQQHPALFAHLQRLLKLPYVIAQ